MSRVPSPVHRPPSIVHRPSSSSIVSLIDISVALREGTPEWPGDTPFSCRWTWEVARGASVNVSVLNGSPHVGTHADAPVHVQDGWLGAGDLPVDAFIGEAVVVDVRDHGRATLELSDLSLSGQDIAGGRLLLQTGCSIASGVFPARWPVLSDDCAHALVDGGLRLLGVDAPSVDERESRLLPVHRTLFAGGACILENLDLREVIPGRYILHAVPVKIDGADAAPVRAILQRPDFI
jgi:arylformamidase